jgi:hypothetical protein
VLNERAPAKRRTPDTGHAYVEELLRAHGAPPRRGAEPSEWLPRALLAAGVRRLRRHFGTQGVAITLEDAGRATREASSRPDVCARLAAADLVLISGGLSSRLVEATLGSPDLAALEAARAGAFPTHQRRRLHRLGRRAPRMAHLSHNLCGVYADAGDEVLDHLAPGLPRQVAVEPPAEFPEQPFGRAQLGAGGPGVIGLRLERRQARSQPCLLPVDGRQLTLQGRLRDALLPIEGQDGVPLVVLAGQLAPHIGHAFLGARHALVLGAQLTPQCLQDVSWIARLPLDAHPHRGLRLIGADGLAGAAPAASRYPCSPALRS